MPYHRGYYGRRRRKMYGGGRGSNMNRTSTSKLRGTAMPDSILVKLKYTDIKQIPDGADFRFSYIGNSPLDPSSITPTSGNALAYTEWSSFYEEWICYGSSCRVRIINKNSNIGIFCALYPQDTINPAPDYLTAASQPYSKTILVSPLNSGGAVKSMKNYISFKKLKGAFVNDTDYSGNTGASPSDKWFWHGLAASTNFVTTFAMTLEVDLVYYMKFYNRKRLTQESIPPPLQARAASAAAMEVHLAPQLEPIEEEEKKEDFLDLSDHEVFLSQSQIQDIIDDPTINPEVVKKKRIRNRTQTISMRESNRHLFKDVDPLQQVLKLDRQAMDID